jgi:cyclophilin family peptidyl-prolyl cis-trans isomerase
MMRPLLLTCVLFLAISSFAQQDVKLKKKDRKRDVELITTEGNLVIRLSDSTPLHRDNFLRLVKSHYLDSMLFHRVINTFMIQSGDPGSKNAQPGQPLGSGGPNYTIPAEFRQTLFHQKGALAAARQGDNVNPERKSSGSQFYIVQGRVFNDASLDSIERYRLNGRKLDPAIRTVYKTIGGTPQLDQNYTVFGQTIKGVDVIDKIATTPTSAGNDRDRPLKDVRIIKARLVKRKRH